MRHDINRDRVDERGDQALENACVNQAKQPASRQRSSHGMP